MTLGIRNFASSLSNTTNNIDFSDVQNSASEAVSRFDAIKKTTLGSIVGQIKGGVEAITKEIDDAKEALQSNFAPVVARVTSNVDGIANKLVTTVPGAAAAEIEAITGKSEAVAAGFLKEVVTAASPEAINTALKKAAGATSAELQTALSSIADINLGSFLQAGLAKSPFGDFLVSAQKFSTQLGTVLGKNSEFFLVDFGEKLSKTFENNLGSIFNTSLSKSDIASAFNFVANGNFDAGFNQLIKYVDLPSNYYSIVDQLPQSQWPADIVEAYNRLNAAEGEFRTLNVELSTYVNQFDPSGAAAGSNSLGVRDIGAPPFQNVNPSDSPTAGGGGGAGNGVSRNGDTWDFSDIKSIEELEALFRAINRPAGKEIAGAIIHWSANFTNQNVGTEWIHDLHIRERGFAGVGYHIIIRRDGTLQRGRPMNQSGAHDENNNSTFLGFCFIGGYNVTSNNATEPLSKYISADSLTSAQFNTYDQLMRTFHKVFPHGQVAGHYMTSNSGKVDPGFDVPGYSQSKFNHINVIPEGDPIWKSPSIEITIATIAQYGAS